MKRETVITSLKEVTNERGRVNLDRLSSEVIAQVARAYISGEKGLLPLYSKEEVAKYYETTENVVSACIDLAIEYRYLKYKPVRQIIDNSADNEKRHALFRGLTKSQKRYREVLKKRFEYFKKTFEEETNRKEYDSAYKMYLGKSSLVKVMGNYGFSPEEMEYLLIRKACIDMTPVEYGLFCQKFFDDFIGTLKFNTLMETVERFRREKSRPLSKLQELRNKNKEETNEFKEIRSMLVEQFEKL